MLQDTICAIKSNAFGDRCTRKAIVCKAKNIAQCDLNVLRCNIDSTCQRKIARLNFPSPRLKRAMRDYYAAHNSPFWRRPRMTQRLLRIIILI